jgi:hypothetical protein
MYTDAGSAAHISGAFPISLQAPCDDAQLGAVSLTVAEKAQDGLAFAGWHTEEPEEGRRMRRMRSRVGNRRIGRDNRLP